MNGKFLSYLTEAATEEKLTHLEHAEDHAINAGAAGYEHARQTLNAVHGKLKNEDSTASITTKYDGKPSILFGRHPETGRFFIASKSGFNKTPKLNFTEKDVDANHGASPGLAAKLKIALKHLPKVTPSTGIYQGDIMHSGGMREDNPEGDVSFFANQAHFKPNTINYSTKDENEAEAARNSKIGVAVHTSYQGPTFADIKAQYNTGSQGFKQHPDVHLLNVEHSTHRVRYTPNQQQMFNHHMAQAHEHHQALSGSDGYETVNEHSPIIAHMKTYVNRTVREETTPSTEGLVGHIQEHYAKEADKRKSGTGKQKQTEMGQMYGNHVVANRQHFDTMWKMHHHLQQAKDVLANALSTHTHYTHTIGGVKVKPEGYVVEINNRPTKIVDRAEFSRANFEQNR